MLFNGAGYILILEVPRALVFFKKKLLQFLRPSPNTAFNCQNCKYLPKLQLGLSHLCDHKFKHSSQGSQRIKCSVIKDAHS